MPDISLEDLEAHLADKPLTAFRSVAPPDPAPSAPPEASDFVPLAADPGTDEPPDESPDLGEGDEGDGEPAPAVEPAQAPEPEEEPPPPAEVAGAAGPVPPPELTPDELAQLTALRDTILADPALAQRIADYYRQGAAPPTPPPGPTPASSFVPQPTYQPTHLGSQPTQLPAQQADLPGVEGAPLLDLSDPSIAALYSLVQQQSQHLADQSQALAALRDAQTQSSLASNQALIARVADDFATSRSLSPADMSRISEVAGRLNVLPALMSGVDPITGLPSPPDPSVALTRTFEIAASMLQVAPVSQSPAQRSASTRRKQHLQAVSGSSASAPRTTPPESPREGLLREVTAAFNGEWSEAN